MTALLKTTIKLMPTVSEYDSRAGRGVSSIQWQRALCLAHTFELPGQAEQPVQRVCFPYMRALLHTATIAPFRSVVCLSSKTKSGLDTLRQAVALPLSPLHGAVILTAVPNSPCHARLGYGKGARA